MHLNNKDVSSKPIGTRLAIIDPTRRNKPNAEKWNFWNKTCFSKLMCGLLTCDGFRGRRQRTDTVDAAWTPAKPTWRNAKILQVCCDMADPKTTMLCTGQRTTANHYCALCVSRNQRNQYVPSLNGNCEMWLRVGSLVIIYIYIYTLGHYYYLIKHQTLLGYACENRRSPTPNRMFPPLGLPPSWFSIPKQST